MVCRCAPLHSSGYGHMADGIGPEPAVHRTAGFLVLAAVMGMGPPDLTVIPVEGLAGDRRAEASSRPEDPISASSGRGRLSGASWADYPLKGNSRSYGKRLPQARSGDGHPPAGTARPDAGGGSHTAARPDGSQ